MVSHVRYRKRREVCERAIKRQRTPGKLDDGAANKKVIRDCEGSKKQGTRQSLMSLGANGEETILSHETQDWRSDAWAIGSLPHAGIYAVDLRSGCPESCA